MKLLPMVGWVAARAARAGLILAGACLAACSTSSSGGGNGSSNAPPTPPSGPKTTLSTQHNYAVHKLYFGDTDRNGTATSTAWNNFGYNLDGKNTTLDSTDVCTQVPGSSKGAQVDGTGANGQGGIDNSFGENVLPTLLGVDSTATTALNASLSSGGFTVMTFIKGFNDAAGNKTNATGLTGVLLSGAKYAADGGAPDWTINTNWPVLPNAQLISGCTATGGCPPGTDPVANALIKFGTAFQTNGTFVNGTPSPLTLSLAVAGVPLALNIASAVITFDPKSPGSVTNGTIAGVLSTADFVASLKTVVGHVEPTLCAASAFATIAMTIEQYSDIVLGSDGKTVSNNAGQQCNAISIGLGFDSTEIAPPSVIAPGSPPAPDPCDASTTGDAAGD